MLSTEINISPKINQKSISTNQNYVTKRNHGLITDMIHFKGAQNTAARNIVEDISDIEFSPRLKTIFNGLIFSQQDGMLVSREAKGWHAENVVDEYDKVTSTALNSAAINAEANEKGAYGFLNDVLMLSTQHFPYNASHKTGRVILSPRKFGVLFDNSAQNGKLLRELNTNLETYFLEHGLGGDIFSLEDGSSYILSLEENSVNPFGAIFLAGIRYKIPTTIKKP